LEVGLGEPDLLLRLSWLCGRGCGLNLDVGMMGEAEYLDELERRGAAYIKTLSASERCPVMDIRLAQERFMGMCDVFTVMRLINAKRELDALKTAKD
jgi:hypothetical protein